ARVFLADHLGGRAAVLDRVARLVLVRAAGAAGEGTDRQADRRGRDVLRADQARMQAVASGVRALRHALAVRPAYSRRSGVVARARVIAARGRLADPIRARRACWAVLRGRAHRSYADALVDRILGQRLTEVARKALRALRIADRKAQRSGLG